MSNGAELLFDGQRLVWLGHGVFRATSGLPDHQRPQDQCLPEAGPTPGGLYVIAIRGTGASAKRDPRIACGLLPGSGWERIPRGGDCEPYFVNWGNNRIPFLPADDATRNRCRPLFRDGFYLHDSTKGYTHGCIEVENSFFSVVSSMVYGRKGKDRYVMRVQYVDGRATNGGTKV